jgi:exonuclease V gamma subunit
VAGLAELDLDGRVVDYAEAAAMARRRLGQVKGDRGEPLAHGVHVSRITPHRPLPFAHIFAVGLGEATFPSADRKAGLELRATVRRGDVSARDRDRYAFLELALAAEHDLVLSYVDREPVTGEARAPASVVHELAEMLAPYLGVAPTGALASLTRKAPLHRFDDDSDPLAVRERYAAELRRALDDTARARDQRMPGSRALTQALAVRADLSRALGLGHGALAPVVDDGPLVVRMTHLRAFLESAPQGWAKAALSLYDDDDDERLDHDEEPLAVDNAHPRQPHPRRVRALPRRRRPRRRRRRRVERRAAHRPGARRRVRRCRQGRPPRAARAVGHRARGRRRSRPGVHALRPRSRAPRRRPTVLPPVSLTVTLDGRSRRVDVVGECTLAGAVCGTLLLTAGKSNDRLRLRAALDHVVLAAAGVANDGWRHLLLADDKIERRAHAPWTVDDARAYLAALCAELYGASHDYLLSLDMAMNVLGGKEAKTEGPKDGRPGTIGYGPLRHRADRAIIDDLHGAIARRYQPLFGRIGAVRP